MPGQPLAILSTGLVTSVGLTAPAACAAIRCGLTNPTETRFIDSAGEWIMAHSVPLEEPWRGRTKLAKMAAMTIAECLTDVPKKDWTKIPLLLCVAERDRPGRLDGLDDQLFAEIQHELKVEFSAESLIIPQGRVGAAVALDNARRLLAQDHPPFVLIAATDSLLTWPTLSVYEREDRLLTARNSNGFMPGEGAGAILVGLPREATVLVCTGVGFATEPAHIASEEPLRGEGLAQAVKAALADSQRQIHDLDFRITDISGEQYYFKEAALALSRLLRQRKEEFDLLHPAECIGEAGATAGLAGLVFAEAAARNAYAPGPKGLAHFANDDGKRGALVLESRIH